MYTYSQSTGRLTDSHGKLVAKGYSGHGMGKNNHGMQGIKQVGPIPCGLWRMTHMGPSDNVGPYTITLVPEQGTETFGRSLFRIHGDSVSDPGNASHGCIIINRLARIGIWESGDRVLQVVP